MLSMAISGNFFFGKSKRCCCMVRVFVCRIYTSYANIALLLWILLFIYHCIFGHCSFTFRARFFSTLTPIFAAQFSDQKYTHIQASWYSARERCMDYIARNNNNNNSEKKKKKKITQIEGIEGNERQCKGNGKETKKNPN